ncbi:MAG: hypothetical protein LKJ90_04415 [Faecalibacterium sp.]|nr:hypothetical protein [Faecalibacterium sp.]
MENSVEKVEKRRTFGFDFHFRGGKGCGKGEQFIRCVESAAKACYNLFRTPRRPRAAERTTKTHLPGGTVYEMAR